MILFTGCNNPEVDDKSAKIYTKVDTLKNKMIGRWGGLGEDSSVWEIRIDSIYYFQQRKTYPYKMLNNDLIIDRKESKGILRNISVIADTMTFYTEEGIRVSGYRPKTQNRIKE